jgi:hypothetical protein
MTFRRFLRRLALLLLSLVCAAGLVAGFVSVRGRIALHRLESVPGALKREYRPLRFMLLSRSDASVSARFFLYDADGREIAAFERSWNGYELDVDTALVPGESGGLAFPVRVFAVPAGPRRGTSLFWYYERDGVPGVADFPALDDSSRGNLSAVHLWVKLFGGPQRDRRRLRDTEIGVLYSLVVRFPGGVSVERE